MSKHTKGPWGIRRLKDKSWSIETGDNHVDPYKVIATVYDKPVGIARDYPEGAEAFANVRLICAAGELLEALKGLWHPNWNDARVGADVEVTEHDPAAYREAVQRAVEAIRLAEGPNNDD